MSDRETAKEDILKALERDNAKVRFRFKFGRKDYVSTSSSIRGRACMITTHIDEENRTVVVSFSWGLPGLDSIKNDIRRSGHGRAN